MYHIIFPNKMEIKEYKESVKKAKEIVENLDLDESLKINAFNTVLKDILDKEKKKTEINKPNFDKKEKIEINSKDIEKEETNLNTIDIPYFEKFHELDWKAKLLNLLKWAKDNHPEKGLVTSDFTKIFNERFGMAYIDSGKINKEMTRRLLKTPLITRKKINKKDFRWFITPKGEEEITESKK